MKKHTLVPTQEILYTNLLTTTKYIFIFKWIYSKHIYIYMYIHYIQLNINIYIYYICIMSLPLPWVLPAAPLHKGRLHVHGGAEGGCRFGASNPLKADGAEWQWGRMAVAWGWVLDPGDLRVTVDHVAG